MRSRLFHNVIQNKNIDYPDEAVDDIVRNGFAGRTVWLSHKPLDDGQGGFVGLVVYPQHIKLTDYRVYSDAIEDIGVHVYEIPAHIVNKWRREQYYPYSSELIYLSNYD